MMALGVRAGGDGAGGKGKPVVVGMIALGVREHQWWGGGG